jgi:hypothetical protein
LSIYRQIRQLIHLVKKLSLKVSMRPLTPELYRQLIQTALTRRLEATLKDEYRWRRVEFYLRRRLWRANNSCRLPTTL